MPLPENQIKEELSYGHLHTLAARAGFSCDRPKTDYQSLDALIGSEGRVCDNAIVYQAQIGVQLKATSQEFPRERDIAYSLPIKNYNDLRRLNTIPRLLVLLVLPLDANKWLEHQLEEHLITRKCAYYLNLFGYPEVSNETSQMVYISRQNVLTVETLTTLMEQASRMELQAQ
jgi:hypothetical protein